MPKSGIVAADMAKRDYEYGGLSDAAGVRTLEHPLAICRRRT